MVFSNDDDQPRMMRKVINGHESEITVARFNFHLSLVVTGTANGELGVWDYEKSTLLAILLGHAEAVVFVEFLSPRPLLVSASQDGSVCIWTVKPVPLAKRYHCLHRFMASSLTVEDYDKHS